MKRYIKYLSFCVLAGVGLASCDTDDNGYRDEPRDVDAYAYASNAITVLDQGEQISIDLFTNDGVQFESVTIENEEGQQLATASIAGEVATFNASSLGEFVFGNDNDEPTGEFDLRVVSTLSNGTVLEDEAVVSVDHAISLEEVPEVVYGSPEADTLRYSIKTYSAVVDNFDLEWKIGEEGTYQDDANVSLSQPAGEIILSDLSYIDNYGIQAGDTLFYRFTATSGALMDQVSTSIAFLPQDFDATTAGTLSDNPEEGQLDLSTGEFAPEGGDIAFLDPTGFEVVGTDSDIEVVEYTGDEAFADIDMMDARAAFNEGSPQTSFTNVQNGDVFVYKVTRQVEGEEEGTMVDEVRYGIIQIGNVVLVNGTAVSFDLEFAEGAIVE